MNPGGKTRIVLVDDQRMFREGLKTLLNLQSDFEIVGEAGDGEQALSLITQKKPDVVLMDLRMPVLDGVATTRKLKQQYPDCKVIVLTTFDDDEYIFDGLRAGAVGYLLKDAPTEQLFDAIRAARRGESVLHPSVAAKVVAEFARLPAAEPADALVDPLSPRELDVLRHLAQGATNREIAETLHITLGTVKNHVTSILSKLDARDRTQAALVARDLRLI